MKRYSDVVVLHSRGIDEPDDIDCAATGDGAAQYLKGSAVSLFSGRLPLMERKIFASSRTVKTKFNTLAHVESA